MKSTVADVMTRQVIVAGDHTPYKTIVSLIDKNDVSALPVIDQDGHVIGIVSEGDLLFKEEGWEDQTKRFRLLMRGQRVTAKKKTASIARDLMTTPAITIRPGTLLAQAAKLMHRHHIKSIPVVDTHDRLVGIVSRKDLLKVFERSDGDIRREVVEDVLHGKLWLIPEDGSIRVDVAEGVVCLEGWVERKTILNMIREAVLGVEGVVDINDRLTFRTDDTHVKLEANLPWGVLPAGLRRP